MQLALLIAVCRCRGLVLLWVQASGDCLVSVQILFLADAAFFRLNDFWKPANVTKCYSAIPCVKILVNAIMAIITGKVDSQNYEGTKLFEV